MKVIRLKPVYIPNDDILVKPPSFLIIGEEIYAEKAKNCTISSTEQLKTILRGRQLKKQDNLNIKKSENDQDIVKNLSDWKNPTTPKTPFQKKFSFKRTATLQLGNEGKQAGGRSSSAMQTLVPKDPSSMHGIVHTVYGIVAVERLKKKVLDAEIQEISERNKKLEAGIKSKIAMLTKDTEGIKKYIRENTEKYENIKKEFADINKKHEEELSALSLNEAQELLFGDKSKKRSLKPGDESQYLIKKEKFRHLKRELHKKYEDDKEEYAQKIVMIKNSL